MNRNIMIVLAGGFLIAVLVALIVQASLSGGKKNKAMVASEKVRIVVAAKDLTTGTQLNDKNLKFQEWPKDAIFEGAIQRKDGKKPNEMVEGTLRRSVAAGEPIMKSALVPENKINYLTASLAPGMRAYSIKLKAEEVAGGFVKPGDYVDVLLTYKARVRYRGNNDLVRDMIEANIENRATETILQKIKVIAIGQDIEREDDPDAKGKKKSVKTAIVTLEVSREDAEVLAISKSIGSITFALRKLGDDQVMASRPPSTTDARVTNIYDEILEKVYRMEKNTSQNGNIVRIYTGVNIEEVTVGQ
jgi:pilus assembly protein CpaB